MLLLAIDTSSSQGSVCLAEVKAGAYQILGCKQWTNSKSHSELITVSIQQLFTENQKSFASLEAVAVGIGPGSFTGVRVAINCARAMGFSKKIPLYTENSLRLLFSAWQRNPTPPATKFVLSVANAFRGQLYTSFFEISSGPVTHWSALALSPEQLAARLPKEPITVIGDGWSSYAETLNSLVKSPVSIAQPQFPHAESLVHLIANDENVPSTLDWRSVIPLYIRGSEAEERLREGALNAKG